MARYAVIFNGLFSFPEHEYYFYASCGKDECSTSAGKPVPGACRRCDRKLEALRLYTEVRQDEAPKEEEEKQHKLHTDELTIYDVDCLFHYWNKRGKLKDEDACLGHGMLLCHCELFPDIDRKDSGNLHSQLHFSSSFRGLASRSQKRFKSRKSVSPRSLRKQILAKLTPLLRRAWLPHGGGETWESFSASQTPSPKQEQGSQEEDEEEEPLVELPEVPPFSTETMQLLIRLAMHENCVLGWGGAWGTDCKQHKSLFQGDAMIGVDKSLWELATCPAVFKPDEKEGVDSCTLEGSVIQDASEQRTHWLAALSKASFARNQLENGGVYTNSYGKTRSKTEQYTDEQAAVMLRTWCPWSLTHKDLKGWWGWKSIDGIQCVRCSASRTSLSQYCFFLGDLVIRNFSDLMRAAKLPGVHALRIRADRSSGDLEAPEDEGKSPRRRPPEDLSTIWKGSRESLMDLCVELQAQVQKGYDRGQWRHWWARNLNAFCKLMDFWDIDRTRAEPVCSSVCSALLSDMHTAVTLARSAKIFDSGGWKTRLSSDSTVDFRHLMIEPMVRLRINGDLGKCLRQATDGWRRLRDAGELENTHQRSNCVPMDVAATISYVSEANGGDNPAMAIRLIKEYVDCKCSKEFISCDDLFARPLYLRRKQVLRWAVQQRFEMDFFHDLIDQPCESSQMHKEKFRDKLMVFVCRQLVKRLEWDEQEQPRSRAVQWVSETLTSLDRYIQQYKLQDHEDIRTLLLDKRISYCRQMLEREKDALWRTNGDGDVFGKPSVGDPNAKQSVGYVPLAMTDGQVDQVMFVDDLDSLKLMYKVLRIPYDREFKVIQEMDAEVLRSFNLIAGGSHGGLPNRNPSLEAQDSVRTVDDPLNENEANKEALFRKYCGVESDSDTDGSSSSGSDSDSESSTDGFSDGAVGFFGGNDDDLEVVPVVPARSPSPPPGVEEKLLNGKFCFVAGLDVERLSGFRDVLMVAGPDAKFFKAASQTFQVSVWVPDWLEDDGQNEDKKQHYSTVGGFRGRTYDFILDMPRLMHADLREAQRRSNEFEEQYPPETTIGPHSPGRKDMQKKKKLAPSGVRFVLPELYRKTDSLLQFLLHSAFVLKVAMDFKGDLTYLRRDFPDSWAFRSVRENSRFLDNYHESFDASIAKTREGSEENINSDDAKEASQVRSDAAGFGQGWGLNRPVSLDSGPGGLLGTAYSELESDSAIYSYVDLFGLLAQLKDVSTVLDELDEKRFQLPEKKVQQQKGTGKKKRKEKIGGLRRITRHVLCKDLLKTQQLSHWGRRPLRRAQLEYAVLDAKVQIDIYLCLLGAQAELRKQGKPAPWAESLECTQV